MLKQLHTERDTHMHIHVLCNTQIHKMEFKRTHKCIVQVHRRAKGKSALGWCKEQQQQEEEVGKKNRARHTKEMEWNGEKRMKSGSWLCECEEPTSKGWKMNKFGPKNRGGHAHSHIIYWIQMSCSAHTQMRMRIAFVTRTLHHFFFHIYKR